MCFFSIHISIVDAQSNVATSVIGIPVTFNNVFSDARWPVSVIKTKNGTIKVTTAYVSSAGLTVYGSNNFADDDEIWISGSYPY